MQVTETLNDGLKRGLKIVVPAAELATRLDSYLADLKERVRIRGFRPGKVPMNHLKRLYGRSAMAEIVDKAIRESTAKAINERQEKSVVQPKIALENEEAERILSGEGDLAFEAAYEIIPAFTLLPVSDIAIERPIAEVGDAEVEAQLQEIANEGAAFTPRADSAKAKKGDRVTLSYVGKMDGQPFEGGSDPRAQVFIGSKKFIPAFEEKMVGVKAGEEKTITIDFPEDYEAQNLAGKQVVFDVSILEVAGPDKAFTMDDAWAKGLGFDTLDALKTAIRLRLERELGLYTKQKVRRALYDALDRQYSFDLPPSLVEQEFDIIWRQTLLDMERDGHSFESEGTTEEKTRAEYRRIAERRVRLGLVLSKIAEEDKIEVTAEEIQRVLLMRARQFPGHEQEVIDFYRKDPNAFATLRAPALEDKVVDYLLSKVQLTDKTVSREELMRQDEDASAFAGEALPMHGEEKPDEDA